MNEINTKEKDQLEEKCGNKESINKTYYNYTTHFPRSELPTLNVEINGIKITALVDTGSEANFIRNQKGFRNKICKNTQKVMAANNSQIKTIGQVKNSLIKIEGQELNTNFIVTDHISRECILGIPFIKKHIKSMSIDDNGIEVVWKKQPSYSLFSLATSEKIKDEFKDIFIDDPLQISDINIGEHTIITNSDDPIKAPMYRMGSKTEELIEKEVSKLMDAKIIRKSTSPWRAPVVATVKKNGNLRMCIDYRKLNAITTKDAYPMPNIEDILDSLQGAKIFSTLDCYSGYYQVKVREKDIEKTAFSCRSGSYEFLKMPFGLVNGPATFQRCMDEILRDEKWKFVSVYLDDVIIYSKTIEEHKIHVNTVMRKLSRANIKLNKDKCQFFQNEVKILGHKVNESGISPDEERIKSIKNFRVPQSKKELQSFLGLVNYCRKFIKNLSEAAAPLYQTLKETQNKDKTFHMCDKTIEAYESIKKMINHDIILKLPDTNKEYILTTDASNIAIGAALIQVDAYGKEQIISFFSKTLNSAQKNYSTTDKELLAIVEAIKHFRPYLALNKFVIRTDHKPITHLLSTKNLSTRLMRWSLYLQGYDMRIEYLKGKNNYIDPLSRLVTDEDTKPKPEAINVIQLGTTRILQTPKRHFIIAKESDRKQILEEYHKYTGHGGTKTMKYHIMQKYYWPGLNSQINKFCTECKICNITKPPQKSRELIPIRSTLPHDVWHCDLIGPLETTDNGNKYILTIIDNFSKCAQAFPLTDKKPNHIIDNLKRTIINWTTPKTIISDNGCEFKNASIANFAQENNIKWKYSSPYHPQTNGVVERFNGTIITKLRKITRFGELQWDKYLQAAISAYSNSYMRAINMTPKEFTEGKTTTYPIDIKLGWQKPNCKKEHQKIIEKVGKHRKEYQKEYSTEKKIGNKFMLGDIVQYYNKPKQITKLGTR
ncbi:MAG: reverse transcriptase domain-containing protein, partial [Aeromonas sp.]